MINFESNELELICRQFNVSRLYVFGSVAKGDFRDDSDVDLIVEFNRNSYEGAFDQFMGLKEALEDFFKRPVDLITSKRFRNPLFERELEETKTLVYAA